MASVTNFNRCYLLQRKHTIQKQQLREKINNSPSARKSLPDATHQLEHQAGVQKLLWVPLPSGTQKPSSEVSLKYYSLLIDLSLLSKYNASATNIYLRRVALLNQEKCSEVL